MAAARLLNGRKAKPVSPDTAFCPVYLCPLDIIPCIDVCGVYVCSDIPPCDTYVYVPPPCSPDCHPVE